MYTIIMLLTIKPLSEVSYFFWNSSSSYYDLLKDEPTLMSQSPLRLFLFSFWNDVTHFMYCRDILKLNSGLKVSWAMWVLWLWSELWWRPLQGLRSLSWALRQLSLQLPGAGLGVNWWTSRLPLARWCSPLRPQLSVGPGARADAQLV